MSFVWNQLQQLGMVGIIMICATGGTVGILKLINHVAKKRGDSDGGVMRFETEKEKDKTEV